MSRNRNLSDEKITFENIREELLSDFEAVYQELFKKLKEGPKYKRLKRVGEEHYYNASTQSSSGMEHGNMRLNITKMNMLIFDLFDELEVIINEKFQGDFLTLLKAKVLEATLKLYSEKKYAQVASEDDKTSSIASGCADDDKEVEKMIFKKLTDLSKYCADNLMDIKNQVIEMPLEENEISATESPKKEISIEGKVEKVACDTSSPRKIILNESKEENLDSAAVSPKKTMKLNSATADPKKTISRESKVKKLESASTSKKNNSSENKVHLDKVQLDSAKASGSKVKKLESATTSKKKNSSENKVHELDRATASGSKVKKLESATANLEKKISSQSEVEELDTDNNSDAESVVSLASVSSVHTSNLSSFDDEIVFSSDEETGEKKTKMSMKEVKTRLAELNAKKMAAEKESQNEVKVSENEHASKSETPINETLNTPGIASSQRVRKPNSKYITDVIQKPLRKSSTEKDSAFSKVSSVGNSLPRKRKRP